MERIITSGSDKIIDHHGNRQGLRGRYGRYGIGGGCILPLKGGWSGKESGDLGVLGYVWRLLGTCEGGGVCAKSRVTFLKCSIAKRQQRHPLAARYILHWSNLQHILG